MITQTFSYTAPLELGDFTLTNDAIYKVKIKNVRFEKSTIRADVTYESYNKQKFGFYVLDEETSDSQTVDTNMSQFILDPSMILIECGENDEIPVTALRLIFEIDEPAADARKEVKDFYLKNLNEKALKGYFDKMNEELTKQTNSVKTDSKEKTSLIKKLMKKSYISKFPDWVIPVVAGMMIVSLYAGLVFLAGMIGAAFEVPAVAITTLQVLLSLKGFFSITNAMISYKSTELKNLGELDNQSIDTPAGKTHLLSKLVDIFDIKPDQEADYKQTTEHAIEIGQKSYGSYFEQFKSLFKKDAYHHGYYIGKEIAAKKAAVKPA